MNVHYTGRQESITPVVRKQVETRLQKLQRVLGPRAVMETRVILSGERHLHRVEVHVNFHEHALLGEAETADLETSLGKALDHLESQALKQKARWRDKTRRKRPASLRSLPLRKVDTLAPAA